MTTGFCSLVGVPRLMGGAFRLAEDGPARGACAVASWAVGCGGGLDGRALHSSGFDSVDEVAVALVGYPDVGNLQTFRAWTRRLQI